MQGDALDMFRAMRPELPQVVSDGVRPAGNLPQGQRDLHSLAMVPGTPGYNSRIPLPPCAACGEDHVPTHEYGHPWMAQQFHDEPVSAGAVSRRPVVPLNATAAEPLADVRVAVYVGRGDTYVVAAEMAPDWETVRSFKVMPELVMPMVNLARALGIKVSDKTGGDLVELGEKYGEPAQAHAGGAASAGDRGARRQAQPAYRAEVDQPDEGDGAPRGLPEPVGTGEGAA